ncbi:hypothetical protein [Rufibacter latericius]|uniref:Uncharacterized protein n=1 Tax=Rufibacter latericius TaxID=2487040 RepID=A0A3M9MF01_9BACT|nr:hypothetical protein [Rufibacter latericius]RNI24142.1 hypothetical protein EFB08_17365 [Rufibacter latericius]
MRPNENRFLMLGLLLQEAKGYQAKEPGAEATFALIDQVKGVLSVLGECEWKEEAPVQVLDAFGRLSAAEGLVKEGNIPLAVRITKLALMHLIAKEALFK